MFPINKSNLALSQIRHVQHSPLNGAFSANIQKKLTQKSPPRNFWVNMQKSDKSVHKGC